MKVIDPVEVSDRGLRDPDAIRGPERLAFILQEFDILMEMEGWVPVFLYERHSIGTSGFAASWRGCARTPRARNRLTTRTSPPPPRVTLAP